MSVTRLFQVSFLFLYILLPGPALAGDGDEEREAVCQRIIEIRQGCEHPILSQPRPVAVDGAYISNPDERGWCYAFLQCYRNLVTDSFFPVLSCYGDVNYDGDTDFLDLQQVITDWGTDSEADLNRNGIVDNADLNIVLLYYGCSSTDLCGRLSNGQVIDLNNDGKIAIEDLRILMTVFGRVQGPPYHPADLDKSGKIDFIDVLILLVNWGSCLG